MEATKIEHVYHGQDSINILNATSGTLNVERLEHSKPKDYFNSISHTCC